MNTYFRTGLALSLILSLAACGGGFRPLGFLQRDGGSAAPPPVAVTPETSGPEMGEVTPEAEAAGPPTVSEGELGTTVASLGDPARPGLWLETPLVDAETPGVLVAEDGTRVDVTLIPSGGAAGSGSRISVLAMQALGLSLTDLATLTVIAEG